MRKTILVVDDDKAMRDVTRRILEAQGYRVHTAGDGRDGLAAVAVHRPDAVLLDVNMPVMDGWTAMRELRRREETRSLPVIMISALCHPDDEREALDTGADGYLVKPFLSPELELRVAAALWR